MEDQVMVRDTKRSSIWTIELYYSKPDDNTPSFFCLESILQSPNTSSLSSPQCFLSQRQAPRTSSLWPPNQVSHNAWAYNNFSSQKVSGLEDGSRCGRRLALCWSDRALFMGWIRSGLSWYCRRRRSFGILCSCTRLWMILWSSGSFALLPISRVGWEFDGSWLRVYAFIFCLVFNPSLHFSFLPSPLLQARLKNASTLSWQHRHENPWYAQSTK